MPEDGGTVPLLSKNGISKYRQSIRRKFDRAIVWGMSGALYCQYEEEGSVSLSELKGRWSLSLIDNHVSCPQAPDFGRNSETPENGREMSCNIDQSGGGGSGFGFSVHL